MRENVINMSIRYNDLPLSKAEVAAAILKWYSLFVLALYALFQSFFVALILAIPSIYIAPKLQKRKKIAQEASRLKLQFKDLLTSLNSSLSAGRALENCFRIAAQDLLLIYPSSQFTIIRELHMICSRLDNGEPLEQSLFDFAERSNIAEIKQLATSLQTCKRSGGDLISVMRKTALMLSEQIEINNEISIIVAQKKFESRIMMIAPFAFMQFMNVAAKDYMANLYDGFGYILICIVTVLLCGSIYIIRKITNISL